MECRCHGGPAARQLQPRILVKQCDLIAGVVGVDHRPFPSIHEHIDAWMV